MQIDPGTAPLLLRLRRNGQPQPINAATISARELSIPEKARKAFHKGGRLLEANDSAGSIVEFQRAIKTFPGFYEAFYRTGIAELSLRDAAAAEAAFRKGHRIERGPLRPGAKPA